MNLVVSLYCLSLTLGPSDESFYAPNFKKVKGAYCFGLVCPFRCPFLLQIGHRKLALKMIYYVILKTHTARSFKRGQLIEDDE